MSFNKNIISLSVAGGGKTTKLLNQVEELKSKNIPLEEILIISFTNSTVNKIKEITNISCYTLHSFLYSMLKINTTIIESHDILVKLFIKKYSTLLQFGIYEVVKLVDSYFINKNPIDLNLLNNKDIMIHEQFLKLINDIENEKQAMNICSFTDIIHYAFQNINSLLADIDCKFSHLLLDEAQDLSKLQLEFTLKMIDYCFCGDYKSFFIIGDPKQSIYDFQDAKESYYLMFINELEHMCQEKSIKLIKEQTTNTYRFGGQILDFVNNKFEPIWNFKHTSKKSEGFVFEYHLSEFSVTSLLNQNPNEKFMILYHALNFSIAKLQNELCDSGYRINLWICYENLVESLRDLMNYCLTDELWYKVKVLQGPFFYINEPNLEILHLNNQLLNYKKNWFNKLKSLKNPAQLLEFLAQDLTIDNYEKYLFKRIYELSHSYDTLASLLLNLPERLLLKQDNFIEFSTIHNAKGLEHENVIYIKSKPRKQNLTVNLNPFFFTKSPIEYGLNVSSNFSNMEYVGFTRAKKNLYIFS